MKTKLWNIATGFYIASSLLLATTYASAENLSTAEAFSGLTALESQDLGVARGRTGETVITTVQSNQNLEANITGSSFSAGTINSGDVTFSEGALENFSGIGLFNIVTGNNNAVNSSVGVSVHLE